MVLRIAIVVFIVFITMASIWMNRTVSIFLLLAMGGLFTGSVFLEQRKPFLRMLQIIFLGFFHWASQLNWTLPLYLILAGKETHRSENLYKNLAASLVLATLYTAIRMTYSESSIYANLVTVSDYLSFVSVVFLINYFTASEREKQILRKKFDLLSTHDELTGLLNYQEFHRRLLDVMKKPEPVALFLIDCTDLKSMNNEKGFQSGDQILRNIAEILRDLFGDAFMIARYGGDEFALVVPMNDHHNTIETLIARMEIEFPKRSGISFSYGHSIYPLESRNKDDLILAAERKLFAMKREVWLKREEHMIQTEKLRLVGELAAGIAHEIRNPLTTVRGFLQMAKENGYSTRPWHDVIMEEITRIGELTGEFLQFSKPHTMNFKIQPLNDCVKRVISLMESEALLLGHQLHLECEPSVQVWMDKDKIVQVLVNLVKNSFEAMEKDGAVFIRVYRNDNRACLTVRDTGPGISKEHLKKIFHPFFTTKKNGTGLGLAICHKIILDHEGSIDVESSPEGTAFHISIPLIS